MYVAKREPAKLVFAHHPYIKRHRFPQVRCSFWLLAWANGCHYNCTYCWLKVYHPRPWTAIHVADKPAYEVRVRIDPIIPSYEDEYPVLMQHVCNRLEPIRVTLGSLRATPRTRRFLPETIRSQLTEKTPWGYGYPLETMSLYNELIDVARRYGVPVALCKEPHEVWRSLKLRSKCNRMP